MVRACQLGQLSKNNLRKIAIIFLSISLNICFGRSKEPSHRDGSFEYPQHMFWLRNKKIIFSFALLSGGLVMPISIPEMKTPSMCSKIEHYILLTYLLIMGLVARENDCVACEQQRRRSACDFAQADQLLCYSFSEKRTITQAIL